MVQLDTGRKISANPDDWRCDETGEKGNLWLNLHTGFIGSGRRHWDGSGPSRFDELGERGLCP